LQNLTKRRDAFDRFAAYHGTSWFTATGWPFIVTHGSSREKSVKTAIVIVLVAFAFASSAFAQDISTATTQAACAPMNVEFRIKADSSQHPIPQVEPGKALVYVVSRIKNSEPLMM
jgi:hypothetical protein